MPYTLPTLHYQEFTKFKSESTCLYYVCVFFWQVTSFRYLNNNATSILGFMSHPKTCKCHVSLFSPILGKRLPGKNYCMTAILFFFVFSPHQGFKN